MNVNDLRKQIDNLPGNARVVILTSNANVAGDIVGVVPVYVRQNKPFDTNPEPPTIVLSDRAELFP